MDQQCINNTFSELILLMSFLHANTDRKIFFIKDCQFIQNTAKGETFTRIPKINI